MLSKFKNYEFAIAIKGYVDKVLDVEIFNSNSKRNIALKRWHNHPKILEKILTGFPENLGNQIDFCLKQN